MQIKAWYHVCKECGKYTDASNIESRVPRIPHDHSRSSRGRGWSSTRTLDDRGFCDGKQAMNGKVTEWRCGRGLVDSVMMRFEDVDVKLPCLKCRIATVTAVDTGAVMGRVLVFAHLTLFDTIFRMMMVREIVRVCDDGLTAKMYEPVDGTEDIHGVFSPHQGIPREWEEKMIFGEELERIRRNYQ